MRRDAVIVLACVVLALPAVLMLLYVLSAGPVLHYSFGGKSFARMHQIYEPVLALDKTKPFGRPFWAYMRLWGFYPGGAAPFI